MTTQLRLVVIDHEPRVDSRLIAEQLGILHKNTRKLIEQYLADFEEFGQPMFETEVGERTQGGGNPEKYVLLNEDQSYLLLTYAQNTPQARELKKQLVRAFGQLRRQAHDEERRARLYAEDVVLSLEQQLAHRPIRYATRPLLVESLDQGRFLVQEQQERLLKSAEINRQIMELHQAGMNCKKIADRLGMSRLAVYGRLERLMEKARRYG